MKESATYTTPVALEELIQSILLAVEHVHVNRIVEDMEIVVWANTTT